MLLHSNICREYFKEPLKPAFKYPSCLNRFNPPVIHLISNIDIEKKLAVYSPVLFPKMKYNSH